jgi:hypothetical protein
MGCLKGMVAGGASEVAPVVGPISGWIIDAGDVERAGEVTTSVGYA